MNNNLDSKLQRTMEQAPARLSKASLKALNSTAEKAPSTRPAAINRPATTQFLNTIAHEQDEVGEALARSINRVNQSLSQASHSPDSEQTTVDSQAKSMAVYTRLAGKLIDRDQGLQEKVAHNLSEPTRPVKTRDAAHSLHQAMAQLPERLQEGTSSGKELAKFMVQNLVQLANTKNMGAGLERDLAMRQINVPHHPVNARQQQASAKVLAASINYIKQNQPEILAKVSTQEPPQQATATSPQPASSPNHERHAVTSAEIEGKTYLDIFKQRSAQSAQQAQSFHPQGRGVPYDEMSAEISQRIHELITKAASNAKSGNLIKLSPEEAANFDRTVSAARERAQGLDPNNTRLQSMLDSGTSTQQPSKVGQGPDGVLPPEHKANTEPVRGLSLSELSARAAKLQQQFRDERQRIVSEGKLPNPAQLPETTFAAPKVPTEPSHSERQQALNHVESNTRELRAALAQAKAALAARIAQGATNTIEQDGTTQPTKAESATKSESVATKPEPALSKADAKPAEAKPTEVKPAEVKPADTKFTEAKPANAKLADAKPTDVKPATAETTTKPTADLAKAETPVKSEAPAKPEVAAKPAPETASKALDLSLLKNTSLNVSYQAVQSTLYGDLDVIPGMTIPVSHFGDLQNEVITPNDKAIEILKAQARVLAAQQQAQANSNLTELVSSAPKQQASTPAQPQVITPQPPAPQPTQSTQPAQTTNQAAQPAPQVVTTGPQQAAAQVAEQAQAAAQQAPAQTQPAPTGTQSAQQAPQVVTSGPQQAAAQVAEQAQAAAQQAPAQTQPAPTGTQSAQSAPQVVTSGPQQAAAQVTEQAQAAAQQTQAQPAPTSTQSAQQAPQVVTSGPQQAAAEIAAQAQAAAQQAQAQAQPAPTGTQSAQQAPQVVTSGPQQAAAEVAAQAQTAAQQAQAQAQPTQTGTQSAQAAPQVVTSGPQQAAAEIAAQAQAAAQQAQAQTQPAPTGAQSAQAAPQVVTSGPQQAAAEIAAQAQATAQQAQAQTQPAPTGTQSAQSAPQVVTSGPQQAAAEIAAQAQAAAQQAQAQTQPASTGTQSAQSAPQVVTSGPQQAAAEIAAQAQAAAQQAQAQTQPASTGTQSAQQAPQVVTSGPQQAAAEIAAQAQAAAQQAQAQTQPASTGTQSAQQAPQVVTSGPQQAAAEIATQAQAAAQQEQAQTKPAPSAPQSEPQVVTSGPQQAAAEIAVQAQAAAAERAPQVPDGPDTIITRTPVAEPEVVPSREPVVSPEPRSVGARYARLYGQMQTGNYDEAQIKHPTSDPLRDKASDAKLRADQSVVLSTLSKLEQLVAQQQQEAAGKTPAEHLSARLNARVTAAQSSVGADFDYAAVPDSGILRDNRQSSGVATNATLNEESAKIAAATERARAFSVDAKPTAVPDEIASHASATDVKQTKEFLAAQAQEYRVAQDLAQEKEQAQQAAAKFIAEQEAEQEQLERKAAELALEQDLAEEQNEQALTALQEAQEAATAAVAQNAQAANSAPNSVTGAPSLLASQGSSILNPSATDKAGTASDFNRLYREAMQSEAQLRAQQRDVIDQTAKEHNAKVAGETLTLSKQRALEAQAVGSSQVNTVGDTNIRATGATIASATTNLTDAKLGTTLTTPATTTPAAQSPSTAAQGTPAQATQGTASGTPTQAASTTPQATPTTAQSTQAAPAAAQSTSPVSAGAQAVAQSAVNSTPQTGTTAVNEAVGPNALKVGATGSVSATGATGAMGATGAGAAPGAMGTVNVGSATPMGLDEDSLQDEIIRNVMRTVPSDDLDEFNLRAGQPLSGVIADTDLTAGPNVSAMPQAVAPSFSALTQDPAPSTVVPNDHTVGAADIRAGQNAPIPEQSVVPSYEAPQEGGLLRRLASLFGRSSQSAENSPEIAQGQTASVAASALGNLKDTTADKSEILHSLEQGRQEALRQNSLDQLFSRLNQAAANSQLPEPMQQQARKLLAALENPVNDLHTVSSWLNFVTGPLSPSSSLALALHQWAFMLLCIRFEQIGRSVDKFLKKQGKGNALGDNLAELEPAMRQAKDIAKGLDGSKSELTGGHHTSAQLLDDTLGQIERLQQQTQLTPPNQVLPRYIPLPPFYHSGKEGSLSAQHHTDEDGGKSWHLNFHFDLEHMGALEVKVKLRFPEVQISFVAERLDTLQRVQSLMPELNQHLAQMGLQSKGSNARLGHISPAAPAPSADSFRYEGATFTTNA